MADFRNTEAIDFVTDTAGQTSKAGVKFLSDFVNGTLDGALTTPFNTVQQGLAGVGNSNVLFYGDEESSQVDYAAAQLKQFQNKADTIGLFVFRIANNSVIDTSSNRTPTGAGYHDIWQGFMIESGDANYFRWDEPASGLRITCRNNVYFADNVFHWQNENDATPTSVFEKEIYKAKARWSHTLVTGVALDQGILPKYNLICKAFEHLFFTGLGPTTAKKELTNNIYVEDSFQIRAGDATITFETYYLNELTGFLFHPDCTFHVVVDGVGTTDYDDLDAFLVAYPDAFDQGGEGEAQQGEAGWLGDFDNGEFLVSRDSDLYTKLTGFDGHPSLRPGKPSWIANSATAGWTYSNASFVSDRLQASASSGYAEIEITLQDSGLKNPIAWLSRGLNYNSHTPTANIGGGSNPSNPALVTFEADYKVVGGAYTGSYHLFHWNEPIGFDGDGNSSGETSYNPTDIQDLQIESIKVRVHVQQGADTADTGIYGFFIAPSYENFCTKTIDQFGDPIADCEVTITTNSETRAIHTNADGFSDLIYIDGLDDAIIKVTDQSYIEVSLVSDSQSNYNFYSLETRKAYYYRVRALKNSEVSPWSNIEKLSE